jgi:rhodanese-related sulfurtransferase
MSIRTIDPQQAHDALSADDGVVYLDVRTEGEFRGGHPEGALNIPAFLRSPAGGMAPNPEFLAVVQANYPADSKLLIGCQMGGRSARACQELAAAGYSDLANVDGGFGGRRDPSGTMLVEGWQSRGLPTSNATEGVSYDDLRARLG